jgi:hypothetical protein
MKKNEILSKAGMSRLLDRLRDTPARDPGAAAEGRRNFLHQAASLRLSVSRRTPASRPGRLFSLLHTAGNHPVMGILVAVFLALVVFFGGSAVTVYAAQDSLPDGALYGVKTFSEDAVLFLAIAPQTRLDLTLGFTDRRLAEIAGLQSAGRPIPPTVVERFENELDQTLALAAGLDDPLLANFLEQVTLHAERQLAKMTQLADADPAAPGLTQMGARLQEQLQDAELGKTDPQGFRLKVRERTSRDEGKPGSPDESKHTIAAPGPGDDSGTKNPEKNQPSDKNVRNTDSANGKPAKPVNYSGTISAVDAGSLTLTLKDGSQVKFILNTDTKVKISGLGNGATLADLEAGGSATVRATKDDAGALVADTVEEKTEKAKLTHFAGTVTGYQPGASITIQDKKGASFTFQISADAKIKFDPKNGGDTLAVGSEVTIVALWDPAGGTANAKEIDVHRQKAETPKP